MEPTCPICLNPIPESKINTLSCGHNICEECISKFIEFNNKCPICNKTFLNFKSKKDNQIHELTKENLTNINNSKKEKEKKIKKKRDDKKKGNDDGDKDLHFNIDDI